MNYTNVMNKKSILVKIRDVLDIYLWKNARYCTRNSIVHLDSSTLPDVLFGDPTYHPPHIFGRTNRNAVIWLQEITVSENTNDLLGLTGIEFGLLR